MTRKINFLSILSFILFCTSNVDAQQDYSAGFINIDKSPATKISIGLWYPSIEQETQRKWGPFRPEFAWNGEPASGKFPIILFSHGVTGRFRNHRDTAAALARAGYVVVAPQHSQDLWVGTDRTVSAIEHRVDELQNSLEIAKSIEAIGRILDEDRIGAIGYSLGSLTILKASGALPKYSHYKSHCDKHGTSDLNFCTVIPWWQKVLLWFKESELLKKKEFSPTHIPTNFQAMVLIAPIGAIFPENEISNIRSTVGIYRLADDDQVKYPFHAEYIYKSSKGKNTEYKVYEGVHHFAFISPFPEWLLEEEYIPVAIDPEGFDRVSFLEIINADITSFFEKNLPINQSKNN